MEIVFIDTNIIIEYLKGNQEIADKLDSFDEVFINEIIVMELYQGARNKRELNYIKKSISGFRILKTTNEIITLAKDILENYTLSHNTKIMDAIIASAVLIYNLKLYTLNVKDFKYLDIDLLWMLFVYFKLIDFLKERYEK